jgi:hypothetical protein
MSVRALTVYVWTCYRCAKSEVVYGPYLPYGWKTRITTFDSHKYVGGTFRDDFCEECVDENFKERVHVQS